MTTGATGRLRNEVVSKSVSDTWEEAVQEWEIVSEREDEDRTEGCVCGHEHLRYLFTIRNSHNGNKIYPIGSTCIKKFGRDDLNWELGCRRKALKLMRAAEDLGKGKYVELDSGFFSRSLIEYMDDQRAFQRGGRSYGAANDDYGFLWQMVGKRSLDGEQRARARQIIKDYVYPWLRDLYREVIPKGSDVAVSAQG